MLSVRFAAATESPCWFAGRGSRGCALMFAIFLQYSMLWRSGRPNVGTFSRRQQRKGPYYPAGIKSQVCLRDR